MRSERLFVWTTLVCLATAAWAGAQSASRPESARSATMTTSPLQPAETDSSGGQAQLATAAQSGANAQASVPRLIRFSGTLHNLAGKSISGPVDVTFSLYAEEAGGAPLWFETQTVPADSLGHYTVLLGAMSPAGVPTELFTEGQARWLGVMVQGLPEQPRVLLVSVPYAMKAGDAETLGGRPASAFQLAQGSDSTSAPTTKQGTTTTRGDKSLTTKSSSPTPKALTVTQSYIPMFADNTGSLTNSVMYQSGAYIGVGTTTPAFPFDLNNSVFAIGPKSSRPGAGGTMRFRDDSGTVRWSFGLPGTAGATDFFLYNNANGHAPFYIQGGAASYMLYLNANGNVGIGTATPAHPLEVDNAGTAPASNLSVIAGHATATTSTNATYGVLGQSESSTKAIGVVGVANATTTSGISQGVEGLSNATSGQGIGVAGFTFSPTGYGVYGNNSGGGYAVYADGSEGVAGNLRVTGNVGIGTTTPDAQVNLSGTNAWDLSTGEGDFKVGNDTYRLKIGVALGGGGAGDARIYASGGTNRMILGTGKRDVLTIQGDKVGIGTITPGASLNVNPATPAAVTSGTGTSGLDGLDITAQSGGNTSDGSSSGGNGGAVNLTAGNGGVDTGNGFAGSSGGSINLTAGSGGGGLFNSDGSIKLQVQGGFSINGAAILMLGANGCSGSGCVNVGVNTTTPSFTLDVNGNINASGCYYQNGTQLNLGSCSSDERLKENIRAFSAPLDQVARLQPVQFNWRPTNPAGYPARGGENTGLIAQQVEQVFPSLVSTDKNGYKMVNYGALPFILLEGVRELKARNDRLREQVNRQQEQIASLNRSTAALVAQNQNLAKQVLQLQKTQSEMASLETRLARLEAKSNASSPLQRASARERRKSSLAVHPAAAQLRF